MKIIATIFVCITIIFGFQVYQYQEIRALNISIRNETNIRQQVTIEKDSSFVRNTKQDISILQEEVFSGMVSEGKVILSDKLNIPEDRIYFDELRYSVAGDKVKSIEYLIGGACNVPDDYECGSFIVDIDTGVISKF